MSEAATRQTETGPKPAQADPASPPALLRDGPELYPSGEPRWMAETWARIVDPARPWAYTLREYLARPAPFVRRWMVGERFAMNPVSFVAASVAGLTVVESALSQLTHDTEREGLLGTALRSIAPLLYFALIGWIAHLFLRATGSRRHLSSTVAMALYAGGTAPMLARALAILARTALRVGLVDPAQVTSSFGWILAGLTGIAFFIFFRYFSIAAAVLHEASWLRLLGANTVALAVSGVVIGLLPFAMPTFHLAVHLWRDGQLVRPSFQVHF